MSHRCETRGCDYFKDRQYTTNLCRPCNLMKLKALVFSATKMNVSMEQIKEVMRMGNLSVECDPYLRGAIMAAIRMLEKEGQAKAKLAKYQGGWLKAKKRSPLKPLNPRDK